MVQKEPDFLHTKITKLLEVFSHYEVPYVIVGGAALALHGIPRSTLDVDIVIPTQTEIIIKLFKAAEHLGLKSSQIKILALANKPDFLTGEWITFEDQNKRQLIDVFLETKSQFKKLYKKSIKRQGRKTIFRVASLKDIEKMKKASGRSIDLADISLIQELRKIKKSKKRKK